MGERHVEELFSAAYDDAMTPAERERYDAHLATCSPCATAAEEFRAAVDAVRALPPARMPVRVVLPATPPVAERRSLLPWLRLPRLGPAWGAGALGAAGIAAVVVAVHAHGGGGPGGGASTAFSLKQNAVAGAPPGAQSGAGAAAGPRSAASCAPSVVSFTTASAAAGSPAGFSNRVAVTNPQRPGQELVLATTSSRYSPGEQVLVFAALTTSSAQRTAVVPCVTLVTGAVATANAAAPPAGGGSAPPTPGPLADTSLGSLYGAPLAIAVPTSQSVAGALAVQVLTIPASVPRGTVLHLLAVIPAGIPGATDQPSVEAVLTVVVS